MANDALLCEIRSFLKDWPLSATYFGRLACDNSQLVKRLESGGTVTLRTAERIRAFIAEHSREAAQ